ncbi:30S ribosomal protein S8e [Candidatus Woesearchaeota archaeon]|nr:30S ribosomal protein S8e [Candidatus Woesearchaeota archaeon]
MVIVQKRSLRKPSGARYKVPPTKRLHQRGSTPARTSIGGRRVVLKRVAGGRHKNRLLAGERVNVLDAAKKKHSVAKIKRVADNPANRHFVRRNIITKGAVVETDLGRVKITNRPGQEGSLQGILVK